MVKQYSSSPVSVVATSMSAAMTVCAVWNSQRRRSCRDRPQDPSSLLDTGQNLLEIAWITSWWPSSDPWSHGSVQVAANHDGNVDEILHKTLTARAGVYHPLLPPTEMPGAKVIGRS